MRFLDIRKLVCVYFSHMTRLGLACFCGLRHDYNSGEGTPFIGRKIHIIRPS